MGCRLRSRLDLLQPDIEAHVYERQSKQQLYSNRHARSREFRVGEAVYVQNFGVGSKWVPGHICSFVGNVTALQTNSASVAETEQDVAVTSTSNAIETHIPKSSDPSQTTESHYPTRDRKSSDLRQLKIIILRETVDLLIGIRHNLEEEKM